MSLLFWFFLILIIYGYLGYPALLFLLARWKSRLIRQEQITPSVTILMSLHNEEDVIAAKLQNLADLRYPQNKLQILFGSDGSTDRTCLIIQEYLRAHPKFPGELIEFPQRRGKMSTLNDLVEKATGEILFMTDARQRLASDALENIVQNFADDTVGCVSGELVFVKAGTTTVTSEGVDLYWRYEKMMRLWESQIHSMLGATGAIYAIRKHLYTPGPFNELLDDMYIPLKIIEQGCRAIFDPRAKAYDQAAEHASEEYRRKKRTLAGNYQIFLQFPNLFNPFTSPIAIQFFSHKFLRVIMPFILLLFLLINGLLATTSSEIFFKVAWITQILFYVLAGIGALARRANYGILRAVAKACYIPYAFCLLNFSALSGLWTFFQSDDARWEKARNPSS